MSLLVSSIEYLLMVIVFESIRVNDETHTKKTSLDKQKNREILNGWNPLSSHEWINIRSLTA